MTIDRRWWLLAAAAVLVAAFFALDLGHWLDLQTIKAAQADLEAWRDARPLAAAAIFFAVYVVATAVSVPGAAALTLVAGALFGLGWGMLIVSFASAIGATLAFLSARWLLRDWVKARFASRLDAIDEGVARDGPWYLFTLRLVPAVPFFIINLAMGLTSMPVRTYYWVSQLGMLPGTLVYVNAGTQLARVESVSGVLSPAVIGSLLLLGVFPLLAKKLLDFWKARKAYARWTRPRSYDRNLVVLGAGSAGLVSAYIAAAVKAKVTLVEAGPMGGDCLNTGCVPSKALLRSARVAALLRRGGEHGLPDVRAEPDFRAVMERVRRVVGSVAPHDSVERFTRLGVDVVQGRARIVTPWQVEIERADGGIQRLTTRAIVVAAGARPVVPDLPGIDRVEVLTSENVWQLRERPRRLLVLGGGPIGCELAQAFARLGSSVTQVEQARHVLSREDPEVSELIAGRLRDDGVRLLTGHQAVRIEVDADDGKALVARSGGDEVRIAFDALLVALGRAARVEGYGLEELGVECGRTVGVDRFMRTNLPNILAAGDVAGPYQFTHTASHQAWYAAVNGLFAPFWKFRADYRVVPRVTFTDPEVAHVGINETQARKERIDHEVTVYGLEELDRAITEGETCGFVKVVTARGSDRILGATVVGAHAGELLAEWTLAMKHGIGLGGILGTIHAYPTLAESAKYAAGQWRLAHAPQALLAVSRRFHEWRRGSGDDLPAPSAATGAPPPR